MKIKDIPKQMNMDLKYTQPYGDETRNALDAGIFNWGYKIGSKAYNKCYKKLRKYKIERGEYSIYLWCDESGYSYWCKQDEMNYIIVTVEFTSDEFKGDLTKLFNDIQQANYDAESMADEYNNMGKYLDDLRNGGAK